MARIGYGRVSSREQDLSIQLGALEKAGCGIVRSEKLSGASRHGRDELGTIMEFIREGDELCVQRLDRLGRSTRDVLNLVHELHDRGARLVVLEPALASDEETGRMLLTVLGMVAELERSFHLERQRAGIEKAKAAGVYRGRKRAVSDVQVKALKKAGHGPTAIARKLGVSRTTVYRALADTAP